MSSYSEFANLMGQLELQKGAALAEGQRQSGQIWGGAINSIGQTIAGLPLQLAQQKELAQRQQFGALQLDQAKQLAAGQQTTDRLMQGDQLPPGDTGPRQESYLSADGLFDIPKLNQALAASGKGHLAQELLKPAEAINDSITKHQALEQQLASQHLLMIGDLADGTLKLAKVGVPILDSMDFVAQPALATKRLKPEEYQQVRQQIASLPPDQQTAVLTNFMDQAAKIDKGENLGKDTQHVDRYNRVTASNIVPPTPTRASIALQAAGGDPATALESLRPVPAAKGLQSENVLLDGKPAMVTFDPATGKRTNAAGEDVSARVKPLPPASVVYPNPQGDQAVKDVKDAVAGMKEGTIPPIIPGRATKEYLATLAEARRQHYDLAAANLDWTATTKHLATLNGAQQTRLRQSVNQLPELLDAVESLAKQWDAGRFPLLNKANLALAKGGAFGQAAASVANKLDAQIADVTADLGNVYMGGNSPTDHALELAGKSLSANWDKKVLLDMIGLARQNVQIRQNSIKNTGVAGASESNPYAAPAGAAAAAPMASGMIRARDPQGGLHEAKAGTPLPAGWTLER